MEKIISPSGDLIALVVASEFAKEGVNFLSEKEYPLQLGISVYDDRSTIRPHYHIKKDLQIHSIQEIIHIDSGCVIATLYDLDNKKFASRKLTTGDTIFIIAGGHGFEILEKTKIIEIKQGPYQGPDKDKRIIGEQS